MNQSAEDARIRGLRPPREQVDPWRALDVIEERERTSAGVVPTVTVFLAGSECPFTCVFCDLWRFTLQGPTPEGAIPRQLEQALSELGPFQPNTRIKLYNASNFFDRRAVPRTDLARIAKLLDGFERVVVECHPRLVGEDLFAFDESLGGRLEIAMGLETVHPRALESLNKKMSKSDYDGAAEKLAARGIPQRAFVLVGAPFVPPRDAVDWAIVSVAYAARRGAETVTLIPVRGGNGELERLEAQGLFKPPTLAQVEDAVARALALPGEAVVQIDLWDLKRFSACSECFGERRDRLERLNLSGRNEPAIACEACAGE